MCGIVGLLADDISREQLARANGRLAHRGPDDDGLFMGDGVGLAARRLSIIDLAGGHQPLSNETGDIWIAYNGEVMNAPALRAELQAAGHQFRTRSDTEVIVHAYEQWGDDCVTRLDGMFAFGLWDGRSPHQPRLLLARDRFGIKPLHYAQSGARFAFASAIRPLFDLLPALPREANSQALAQLFRWGWVPTPLTMFAGVKQLPAAHLLVVERGQVTIRPYWTPLFPPANEHARPDEREAVAQFMTHLREAVAAWRMSDVPVGSLLSGGVDSGALAALLTELSGPIHTFHIAFAAASHDESAYAAQTAQAIGSRHHTLTFTNADFDHLPDVVRHLESPQCSATSIPIYLLYRACREAGFKVILTGEGADELLGGYHWFDGDRRVRPFLPLPRPLRQLVTCLPLPISAAGRRVLANGTSEMAQRFRLWHEAAAPDVVEQMLITGDWRLETETSLSISNLQSLHPLHQFLALETATRLPDFINLEVDRMSMANSVEARPPFLDHRLWEFCAQLPPELKLNRGMNKWVLRQGMAGVLPAAVAHRPKQGLASPHAAWWRMEKLPVWAEEALHPTALTETGDFNVALAAKLRAEHGNGRADHSRLLMGILTTQLWHDMKD